MDDPIDPDTLYSFSEARRRLRSCRGGSICLRTLHRWRMDKRFEAVCRVSGNGRHWFVWGRELLRLMPVAPAAREGTPPASAPPRRSRAEQSRVTQRILEEFGLRPKKEHSDVPPAQTQTSNPPVAEPS